MGASDDGQEPEPWLIGVDVGGTFTDGVLLRAGQGPVFVKSPTRADDPVAGLAGCLDRLADAAGLDRRGLLARTGKFAYGTTQAANMLVEGTGATTAFITTKGFRDTLTIAGIGRERVGQDLTSRRQPSLVPRHLIHEVSERVVASGDVLTPLDMRDVTAAIEKFHRLGAEAVGVCLLWSFRNDTHERKVAGLLRDAGEWFVSASCECAPLLGEYERSAATALNARLGPAVRRHLDGVAAHLAGGGLRARPLIMTSAGGLLPLAVAAQRPVSLLASGPAGGVLACLRIAESMGVCDVICGDMGGTTFDVSVITGGRPSRRDHSVHGGHEITVPAIEIVSVGAGGGSVAWVDHGPRLKVGPTSAGAHPGPACYGRGGLQPTVTDADLVLGKTNPAGLAGGAVQLRADHAAAALDRLAAELRLDRQETAAGVVEIVDSAMADAIRVQTVTRGLDPRDYTLFAYGGAGALHAAALAREIGLARVVVPQLAPVLSGYGVVASDIVHILSRSVPVAVDNIAAIAEGICSLEAEAGEMLDRDQVPDDRRVLGREATLRFTGQLHSVSMPVPAGDVNGELLEGLSRSFVARYEALYGAGTASPDVGVEIVSLTVRATGLTRRPIIETGPVTERKAIPAGERPVWQDRAFVTVPCYAGPMSPGSVVEGPAIIDYVGSSVWIPSDAAGTVNAGGSLVMELG